MTEKTVEVSQDIIDHARDAKGFIHESGEASLPDELLVRASVAFNMLQQRGMVATIRTDGDPEQCKPHPFDGFDRAFAIALIAHNFDDHPPTTPQRAVLFGTKLTLPWQKDEVGGG